MPIGCVPTPVQRHARDFSWGDIGGRYNIAETCYPTSDRLVELPEECTGTYISFASNTTN
jgi:hypothetical protein